MPHPAWPLSTLQTPRCRDARKTRSRPARYGFGQMRLSLTGTHQLGTTYSRVVWGLLGRRVPGRLVVGWPKRRGQRGRGRRAFRQAFAAGPDANSVQNGMAAVSAESTVWVLMRRLTSSRKCLALQLHILFQMRALRGGLVRPAPERPGDDACGLDALLCQAGGDAADFLERPADEAWRA